MCDDFESTVKQTLTVSGKFLHNVVFSRIHNIGRASDLLEMVPISE